MFSRLGASLLLLPLAWVMFPQDQQPKPTTTKPDYSQEAFLIEHFTQKEKYENDGTSSKEVTGCVRVQSDAGVHEYGLLNFIYASGTGTFEVAYVRVRKPDGSVVETPPESIQDMPAQVTREAPFYSDIREKHVAVKGLSVGDIVEYQTHEHTTKPLAPGQFWTNYTFTHNGIVLDEQLEISVPRNRTVKVKSATIQPVIGEAGEYRVYTWHSSNLQHDNESNKKRDDTEKLWQLARGRLPAPDVQMSSFTSWDEVGRWYGGLQDEQVKPTAEVTAKAAELTRNAADDDAKMRALYSYVSTQFRYIGIAFGIGRYQPHSAGAVLENQYGDCKDKHTLLASLLSATGIPAYPALISTSHDVDADVPSPGQFDHVITVVPKADGLIWLDSTSEVGPYQYLLPPLRDKQALAIWKDKPAALVTTPASPPFPQVQRFTMKAKLSDAGVLEGNADYSFRGDLEYYLRAGFRAVPFPQWKDLAQRISLGLGFGGDVSDVTASSTEKTDEAFHFSYRYTRKDFGDWAHHQTLAPEPLITLPAPSDEESLPLGPSWLGSPTEILFRCEVELPAGNSPNLPGDIHLKQDFAEFDATYEFKDGKMITERHLKTLLREVPAAEREQYKKFVKTIQDDYGAFIPLSSGASFSATADVPNSVVTAMGSMAASLRNLPNSLNTEATRLESAAHDAGEKNDTQTAVSSLYRAVAADPKFARAWVTLGILLFAQKQQDAAIEAFHKAMDAAPGEAAIPKALGYGLMADKRWADAVPVWQDFIKAHPADGDGPANLGICLIQLERYSEAAVAFEAALKIRNDRPNLQMSLASAYLHAGDRDKAAAAFHTLAEMDKDGAHFNDIAYIMANEGLDLPAALDYSRKAVLKAEQDSEKVTLADLKVEDLAQTARLAANWDTLGWIYEQKSEFSAAEPYLKAAWKLSQDGVVAAHLCQLYSKMNQTANAIRMCRIAVYRLPMAQVLPLTEFKTQVDEAQKTLNRLTGEKSKPGDTAIASDLVVHERRFELPRFTQGTESAEFFVLLASDGKSKALKAADVKFISGSQKLKLEGKRLMNIDFNVPAPDDTPSHAVRRGFLGCYQYSGCSFIILDPASVHSVN
jgi:tetratricopeptide (TPR) repeat protein